jgi:hypothetical protein
MSDRKLKAPLIVHAADALRRARKLPIGAARNDLRELAQGLLNLHRSGLRGNVEIIKADEALKPLWRTGNMKDYVASIEKLRNDAAKAAADPRPVKTRRSIDCMLPLAASPLNNFFSAPIAECPTRK